MGCIKRAAIQEPLVDNCEKQAINTDICRIFECDLYTCKKEDLDFSSQYSLKFKRNDSVHAVITWFDIFFDKLPNKVNFSTGPYKQSTHWKQTVFYTDKDFYVEKGNYYLYI